MSSRVDRGTADGSLYRAMKQRTKRHKATNWPFENFVRSPFDWNRRQDRSDVPLNPITVYLLWPQSYTRAHVAGAYRFSMRHEVIVKQKASIPVLINLIKGDGRAIHLRFDLEPLTQQIPRRID